MNGLKTLLLIKASNVFMTFARYAHLRDMRGNPWILAVLFESQVELPGSGSPSWWSRFFHLPKMNARW